MICMICFDNSPHTNCCQLAATTSFSYCSHHPSHTLTTTATLQRPSTSRLHAQSLPHNESHCTNVYNSQRKTTENATTTQRAHPAVPTWPFALVVAFQTVASLSNDSALPLRPFFRTVFFAPTHTRATHTNDTHEPHTHTNHTRRPHTQANPHLDPRNMLSVFYNFSKIS